jgi:hypothetical protein
MSELFMRIQTEELRMLPRVAEQWIAIALDETQEPIAMQSRSQNAQVMVIHIQLFRLPATEAKMQVFNVVLPTVVLAGTTTDDIYGGLLARLPVSLEKLASVAEATTFLLNTDSAGSCLKLGKCLKSTFPCLTCPCRMHQLCIAMTCSVARSGLMACLYCGSLLLRRARFQKMLRWRLERYIYENLRIVFEPPTSSAASHAKAVWDLIWPLLQRGHSKDRRLMTPRAQAWRRLRKNLGGPLDDNTCVIHYCSYGCHKSRDDAAKEICQDLCVLFLDSPPMVPVWNKWTKVTPPLMWLAPLIQVHGLLSHIVQPLLLTTVTTDASAGWTVDEDLDTAGLTVSGLQDNAAFEREERARVRRFVRFASAARVGEKVTATLLALLPGLDILGSFFSSAEEMTPPETKTKAATSLCLSQPSKSPAVSTVKKLLSALSSEDHPHWQALRLPSSGWQPVTYQCAAAPTWVEVGQLWSRLVLPFRDWPWKAGQLLEEDVSAERQEELAKELLLVLLKSLTPLPSGLSSLEGLDS